MTIAIVAATWVAGCSSAPRTSATPAQQAVAAAQPPATVPPRAAGDKKPKSLSDYKVRMKDGRKYYCRKQALLGSRFEKMICLTEEQVAEAEARTQDAKDGIDRAQKTCGGKMCGAN